MVLVARVRGQGREAQIVVNEDADGQQVAVITLARFQVRVDLLACPIQCGVINDIAVKRIPDIAAINCAVHGTRLLSVFVVDNRIDGQSVTLVGGRPTHSHLAVFDFTTICRYVFRESALARGVACETHRKAVVDRNVGCALKYKVTTLTKVQIHVGIIGANLSFAGVDAKCSADRVTTEQETLWST